MIDNSTFGNITALYHTFGCKLNFAETSTVARILSEQGIVRVQQGDTPDIIVINTCSVTELADKKCRQTIRSFSKRYPDAAIVVTGCYAQLKSEEAASLHGVAIVAGSDKKLELRKYIDNWLIDRQKHIEVTQAKDMREFSPSCSRGDRTRFFLKVQDGCDYFCSYCTIPFARGRSRSGSISQMVEQARKAADEGGREIVLTGVNIGDFGKGTSETFFDLIRALDEVNGIDRYRISSIEPNLLTDEIITWVASSRHFMPHFHIPLQSGDNDVLRLMRRHYDTDLFRHRIDMIRNVMPHAFIGVDIIVGARGETQERFEKSQAFVESLPISRLHVFPYSERPGTMALNIAQSVEPSERHRRARVMLNISERKLSNFNDRFVATIRPVLVEHRKRGSYMSGFTDNYIKVSLPYISELDNCIVPVKITENLGTEVKGEVMNGL